MVLTPFFLKQKDDLVGYFEQIYYKDKNINDILKLSIEKASIFFKNHKPIHRKLNTLINDEIGKQ